MASLINNFLSSTQATAQAALFQVKETLVQKLSPTEQKVTIAAFAALALLTLGIIVCCRLFSAKKIEPSQKPLEEIPNAPLEVHNDEPLVVLQQTPLKPPFLKGEALTETTEPLAVLRERNDSPLKPVSPKDDTLTETTEASAVLQESSNSPLEAPFPKK